MSQPPRTMRLQVDGEVIEVTGDHETLARIRGAAVQTSRALAAELSPRRCADDDAVERVGGCDAGPPCPDRLRIDLRAGVVRRGDAVVRLRPKELALLEALLAARGRIVSREALLSSVWGYAAGVRSRTLDTHVSSLRRKLGCRLLVAVRNRGYRVAFEPT